MNFGINLEHAKVGDTVVRILAGNIPMEQTVSYVDDKFIYTSPLGETWKQDACWRFWRDLGTEYDPELGLGDGRTGLVISFIKEVKAK
jgi:hypothetical protein